MFGLGMGEILMVLVIALVILGPKKLPELAKTIGKGFRDFQRAKQGLMDDINTSIHDDEHRKPNQHAHQDEGIIHEYDENEFAHYHDHTDDQGQHDPAQAVDAEYTQVDKSVESKSEKKDSPETKKSQSN